MSQGRHSEPGEESTSQEDRKHAGDSSAPSEPRGTLARHPFASIRAPIFLILVLFAAFRLGALVLFRPGGFIADFSDYYYYREYAALVDRGYYPFVNIWSPYPPLFPWLLVAIYRLTLLLPAWEQPQLWSNLALGAVMTLADCGNLLLVYGLAGGRREPARALRSAIFYALLFLPAYTAQAHFDILGVFFLLLGLWLIRSGHWTLAGLATGVGVMVKLLPALLVPLAVRRALTPLSPLPSEAAKKSFPYRWERGKTDETTAPLLPPSPAAAGEGGRGWVRAHLPASPFAPFRALALRTSRALVFLAATALVIAAVAAPFFFWNPRLLLAPLDVQRIRPPWQTVWAVLDGYYGFGVAPADVRDLTALSRPEWRGHVPYTLLTLVFLATYLWLYLRRANWRRERSMVAFAGLGLGLMFIFSKGWSPQYLAWLLPFVAVLWPSWRGAAYTLSLSFLNYLESHVYFMLLPQERWLLILTTTARTFLLAALTVELALEYLGREWPSRVWRRRLAWGMTTLAMLGLPLLTWRLLASYNSRRYEAEPARPAIERLRAEAEERGAMAYFPSLADMERFYPHLHARLGLRVLDDYAPDRDLERRVYSQIISDRAREVWLLYPGPAPSELALAAETALSGIAYRVEESTDGPYAVSRWVPHATLVRPQPPPLFGEQVELLGWRVEPGVPLRVTLIWRLRLPLDRPLSAFVHIVAADGRPLAQRDGAPAWPWEPGQPVRDRREIGTADLAPGSYRVLVGVYDPETLARLRLSDGSDALELQSIRVGP